MTDPSSPAFLPADATWAGVVLLLAGGLFLAALAIGIVARLVMPERYAETKPVHHAETAETDAALQAGQHDGPAQT